jgi:hypothetical protein
MPVRCAQWRLLLSRKYAGAEDYNSSSGGIYIDSEEIGNMTLAQARQLVMEWRKKLHGRKFTDSVELICDDRTR